MNQLVSPESLSKNRLSFLGRLLQKKYRDKEGLFLVEGARACKQAIETNAEIREFVITDSFARSDHFSAIADYSGKNNVAVWITDDKKFALLSDTDHPQGIVAVVKMPTLNLEVLIGSKPKPIVAVDRLQDPGNLGTIIRTAEWLGVGAVLCGEGTVDSYNPKVLRSAMGANFSLPIFSDVDLKTELSRLKIAGYSILGTSARSGSPITTFKAPAHFVLLLGSEAHGLAPSLEESIDQFITIPGKGRMESLNASVAAGILLYELTKQPA